MQFDAKNFCAWVCAWVSVLTDSGLRTKKYPSRETLFSGYIAIKFFLDTISDWSKLVT